MKLFGRTRTLFVNGFAKNSEKMELKIAITQVHLRSCLERGWRSFGAETNIL